MDVLLQDLRFGVRRLRSRPGFTAIAVLTLALGIGANAAIFSLIRGILLEPLPYAEADRLVMVWKPGRESDQTWLSRREWVEYSRSTRSFEQLAGYTDANANLTEGAEPERVRSAFVTGNTFDALGVGAVRGRAFTPEDDRPGQTDIVLLGYNLWQRRFAGSPDVVGKVIRVNGTARTVVGVMPSDFRLPLDYREEQPTELWLPAGIDPANAGDFGDREYFLFGRLRAGVTAGAATADLHSVLREWEQKGYVDNKDGRLRRDALPLQELLTGNVKPALLVLFGAVGFILLIACANVTNLLLARADARRRDVATQAALGASRSRIVRQLLTESGVLALLGAALGIVLAFVGLRAALALTPVNVIRMRGVSLDLVVLVFSALLALGATVLAGLAPALQLARVDLGSAMSVGGRSGAVTLRKGLRRALVLAETALSVVLVIGAGLLLRSFVELRRIDLGFSPENILTLRIGLPATEYREPARAVGFYQELLQRVEALSGVRSAAGVRLLPLTGTIGDWSIMIENQPRPPGSNPNGDWQIVTPRYFETMGVELVRGRFLTDADGANAPPVVLIDENMAKRYWPGEDALGKRFHLGTRNQPWMTIVGITRPVRHNAVVEEPRTEMFLPHAQFALQTGSAPLGMTIVVKTTGEPLALLPAVREQVRTLNASLPISEVRTMEQVTAAALAQPRFLTVLLGVFGSLALLLAAIGLYGVISYMAARRTHEIGLRMALGAARGTVIRMVLSEGLLLATAGVACGVTASIWLTRFLAGQLYGVRPLDPLVFASVPLLLIVIASAAAFVPAVRAARTSPLVALRNG
jgi:putative ABC transport system permease protein